MNGIQIDPDKPAITHLYVQAQLGLDGSVTILPCDVIISTDTLATAQQNATGTHCVFTALGADGKLLAAADVTATQVVWDPDGTALSLVSAFLPLPSGSRPAEVFVSLDGGQGAALKLGPDAPNVELNDEPPESTVVAPAEPVRVAGRAWDLLAGPVEEPAAYRWFSDLEGDLGIGLGRNLVLTTTGTHTVSLPPGGSPTYNPHPIGVWFDGQQWNVFNQDIAAMPSGASFCVQIAKLCWGLLHSSR